MLKPCPFCGGPGRIESSQLSTLSWPVWEHRDRCPMKAAIMWPNPEEALEAGNKRAPPQTADELVSIVADWLDADDATHWGDFEQQLHKVISNER